MLRKFINSVAKITSILIIFVVLLILNFRLWKKDHHQENEVIGLQKELSLQQKENATMSGVNNNLKQKIDSLKQGSMEMIEEEARNNFGMVGEGETYYRFEEKTPPPKKQERN